MTQERTSKKPQEARKRPPASETAHDHSVTPAPSADLDINMMTPPDIMALQRQVGNQAVMRMLKQRSSTAKHARNLPDQLEGALGKAFGTDLSGVQIHTDATANQVARTANADATSIGNDIYFREGAYNPGTARGNALIAREIAHVEHARSSGDADRSSSEASASESRDAENVSGIVEAMGANPAQILQPIHQKPTQAQRRVLQRAGGADTEGEYSHSRSFGIASSKIVQGVFTTILGPLSLVWRWPLIQKNMGEALGDDIGTWKGKPDDKLRYGGGNLGEALRFMAITTEILKELLIWCGFASLIAAIVAGATHGALTPVFVGIAVVTAIIGGVLAGAKFIMAGLNTIRYFKAKESGADGKKKRAHIKAQIANDLFDGVGALLTTVFAALGAGGVTATIGGVGAKEMGFTGGEAKGVGAGLNMATQGIITNVVNNTAKESFKEAGKPGKEHGVFGGKSGVNKDGKEERGGFFKDALVIEEAYKPAGKRIGGAVSAVTSFITGRKPAQETPTIPTASPEAKKAIDDITFVVDKTQGLQVDQQKDVKEADKATKIVDDNAGKAIQTANDIKDISTNIADTEVKGKAASANLDDLITVKDESEADAQEKKLNEGLAKVGEAQIDGGKKPSVLSRIGSWFTNKITGIRQGTRRLMNWIMKGVMNFAARFSKSDVDPNSVALAMNEEKTNVADVVSTEQTNTGTIADINAKAVESQKGIVSLAEQEAK